MPISRVWDLHNDSEWMFAKLVLLDGKLGVMRVVTSQWGLTSPSSIFFSLGLVRDIVPLIIINYIIAWLQKYIYFWPKIT